jgi:hypothetical protein
MSLRSAGVSLPQGPSSAARAAQTAASTSAALAFRDAGDQRAIEWRSLVEAATAARRRKLAADEVANVLERGL